MDSQFLDLKLDHQSHLEDCRLRQESHPLGNGQPRRKQEARAWLVYPADWLIWVGLKMKRYATRESELVGSKMIHGLGL